MVYFGETRNTIVFPEPGRHARLSGNYTSLCARHVLAGDSLFINPGANGSPSLFIVVLLGGSVSHVADRKLRARAC